MPKAYVIFTEKVHDTAGMDAYAAKAMSAISNKAVVLAADSDPQVLEGQWHGERTVMLEFESLEAARAWYESPAYQEAIPLRQRAAETNVVIVSGL